MSWRRSGCCSYSSSVRNKSSRDGSDLSVMMVVLSAALSLLPGQIITVQWRGRVSLWPCLMRPQVTHSSNQYPTPWYVPSMWHNALRAASAHIVAINPSLRPTAIYESKSFFFKSKSVVNQFQVVLGLQRPGDNSFPPYTSCPCMTSGSS